MHLGTALTSATAMTLDARFTQLRRGEILYQDGAIGCSTLVARGNRPEVVASASIRNRRLAIQMSRRPAVVAALNRGFSRNVPNGIMNRLGRGAIGGLEDTGTFRSGSAFAANSMRRRSNSANRVRGGGGGGAFRRGVGGSGRRGGFIRGGGVAGRPSRPLYRSNSVSRITRSGSLGRLSRSGSVSNLARSGSLSRLTRSQSLQSLSGWANNAFRGRGVSRGRRRGRGGGVMQGFIVRRSRDTFIRRGRGGGQSNIRVNRGRNNYRGRLSGIVRGGIGEARTNRGDRNSNSGFRFSSGRGSGGRGFRGGRGRGRGGRGRGGRGRQKEQVPSKEALDMEIDEYMSTTKSHLDKEIDSYMNQPTEDNGVAVNQTNGNITGAELPTESWD